MVTLATCNLRRERSRAHSRSLENLDARWCCNLRNFAMILIHVNPSEHFHHSWICVHWISCVASYGWTCFLLLCQSSGKSVLGERAIPSSFRSEGMCFPHPSTTSEPHGCPWLLKNLHQLIFDEQALMFCVHTVDGSSGCCHKKQGDFQPESWQVWTHDWREIYSSGGVYAKCMHLAYYWHKGWIVFLKSCFLDFTVFYEQSF